jgi:hypothetical protein
MSACGVADSAELDTLTKALNDNCARHHIADKDGRERIAIKVMMLFGRGVSDLVQLSMELNAVPFDWSRRVHGLSIANVSRQRRS